MISKIKEAFAVIDELKSIKVELSNMKVEFSKTIAELKESEDTKKKNLDAENIELQNLKKQISLLKDQLSGSIAEINSELRDFRITRNSIQDKLYSEFKDESKQISKEMSSYLDDYKKLESEVKIISSKISGFSATIDSLNSLSKTILEKDFELKKYASILESNDRDKVNLLKKIDSLEKLLASMKRNRK
ncbi:hypothetical protein JXM83_02825 [Candidatus Woesearchaeota archaeon]|nr:hypothetical protein [Candidatus Woesearchaeota archaeon]